MRSLLASSTFQNQPIRPTSPVGRRVETSASRDRPATTVALRDGGAARRSTRSSASRADGACRPGMCRRRALLLPYAVRLRHVLSPQYAGPYTPTRRVPHVTHPLHIGAPCALLVFLPSRSSTIRGYICRGHANATSAGESDAVERDDAAIAPIEGEGDRL